MARRSLVGFAVALSCVVVPELAHADTPGRGSLMVGAERMTGIYSYSYKHVEICDRNLPPCTVEDSGTMLNLLWNNSAFVSATPGGDANIIGNVAAIPRLAVDYGLTDLITLGGSVGYFSASGSTTALTNKVDLPTLSGFAFSPRVGFMIGISSIFAIWPRVGMTYTSLKYEQTVTDRRNNAIVQITDRSTWSQFSVDADVTFVVAPVPHFGFTFGPLIALPLSGSRSSDHIEPGIDTSTSRDAKLQNIGFSAGLIGWF